MIIEKNNQVSKRRLKDVQPGDCFQSVASGAFYMKLFPTQDYNIVNLRDGALGWKEPSEEIVYYPNAKVIIGDPE